MTGVNIDRLIQREGNVAGIKSGVGRAIEGGYGRLSQASEKLLDITDTLSCGGSASWAVAVPKVQI